MCVGERHPAQRLLTGLQGREQKAEQWMVQGAEGRAMDRAEGRKQSSRGRGQKADQRMRQKAESIALDGAGGRKPSGLRHWIRAPRLGAAIASLPVFNPGVEGAPGRR